MPDRIESADVYEALRLLDLARSDEWGRNAAEKVDRARLLLRSALRTPPASACDGSFVCDAQRHEHGCFADRDGTACTDPEDHDV